MASCCWLSLVILFCLCVVSIQGQDYCLQHPSSGNCTNYQLPNVQTDISSLCGMMSNMAGCTVERLCTEDKGKRIKKQKEYCEEFSILKDLCTDMGGMDGCNRYNQMCAQGSVIKECNTASLPIPGTMMLSKLITDMCNQMNMPECSKCAVSGDEAPKKLLNCDLLQVYSDLCMSMPDMENCTQWHSFCQIIPDWPLCDASHNPGQPPVMRMFFHTGMLDYVLFKDWVPRSTAQYAGTWLAVFFFTVLYEFLKLWRNNLEKKWSDQIDMSEDGEENVPLTSGPLVINRVLSLGGPTAAAKFRPSVDFPRAFLQAVEVAWSFLIMLVVMTYNVGLFFAVLAGVFVGTLLVGRFLVYKPKAGCH